MAILSEDALKASPEFAELMAGKPRGRLKDGRDLGKTVARKATVDEQWRYGVELRIQGSRWRPQKRAPHYPVPEPYVYRKATHPLVWLAHDHNRDIDDDYRAWLAERDAAKAKAIAAECLEAINEAEIDDGVSGDPGLGIEVGKAVALAGDVQAAAGCGGGGDNADGERSLWDGDRQIDTTRRGDAQDLRSDQMVGDNIVPFIAHAREPSLDERKADAAAMMREIAGNYGPRRAHKLRAMADWLEGKPAVATRSGAA